MLSKKVLIVDDSPSMGRFLQMAINASIGFETVGVARDPYHAREMIKTLKPDLLTLDVEMPKMDGITFLRNLMRLHPMPVVMVSSLTAEGTLLASQALSLGALEIVGKRSTRTDAEFDNYVSEIQSKLKSASRAQIATANTVSRSRIPTQRQLDWCAGHAAKGSSSLGGLFVAVGSSTGGPQVLQTLFSTLNAQKTAAIVAQHIPQAFLQSLAETLDAQTPFRVRAAKHGDRIKCGTVLLAPGDCNAELVQAGGRLYCHLNSTTADQSITPSVDHLFQSVARVLGSTGIGVLLTGMGNDGAYGMRALHQAGALTIAQDQSSSAVWGMPRAAVQVGAVDAQLSAQAIPEALNQLVQKSSV
ncbi:MAG: chemotaxis-specific protein-glutamate methyltransferase CheB [Pseudomonadales bacterium]